jgi:hypothetical protein
LLELLYLLSLENCNFLLCLHVSLLGMALNCLFYLLGNLAVELALPFRGVALRFVSHTILHVLPFLELKTVEPELML